MITLPMITLRAAGEIELNFRLGGGRVRCSVPNLGRRTQPNQIE